MKRSLLLFALFLLTPRLVAAQAHYCDTPQPTNGSAIVGATLTLQHCNDGKDQSGTVNVAPTSFKLYDNGTGTPITMTKGTTSAVSGKTVYSGSYVVPSTPGVHTLQTTAVAGTSEGAKSNVFTLTATAAVPSAPTNLSGQ